MRNCFGRSGVILTYKEMIEFVNVTFARNLTGIAEW